MSNSTLSAMVVQRVRDRPEVVRYLYTKNYLVVLKRKGRSWVTYACLEPGKPFTKPPSWSPSRFEIYVVRAAENLRWSFVRDCGGISLSVTIDYSVSAPDALVKALDSDPLGSLETAISDALARLSNSSGSPGFDFEKALRDVSGPKEKGRRAESAYTKILRFAASKGLTIRHLTITRHRIPDLTESLLSCLPITPFHIGAPDLTKRLRWYHRRIEIAAGKNLPATSFPNEVLVSHAEPHTVKPHTSFLLEIILHLSSVEPVAQEDLKVTDAAASIHIASGAELLVSIVPPKGFSVDEGEAVLAWRPPRSRIQFLLNAGAKVAERTHWAKVRIRTFGEPEIELCRFYVQLQVSRQAADVPEAPRVKAVRRFPRTAFASYSRKDISTVLQRVAALQSIGVEVFLDCLDINEGEKWEEVLEDAVVSKDAFLLFWSRFARDSKWVEKEWRHALHVRGLSYISPNALEPVNVCPPPPELAALQFGSKELLLAKRVVSGRSILAGGGRHRIPPLTEVAPIG